MPRRVGRPYAPLMNGDPLLRQLYQIINEQDLSYSDVCERAGLSHATLYKWKEHKNPLLSHFKATLGALGYELEIKKCERDLTLKPLASSPEPIQTVLSTNPSSPSRQWGPLISFPKNTENL